MKPRPVARARPPRARRCPGRTGRRGTRRRGRAGRPSKIAACRCRGARRSRRSARARGRAPARAAAATATLLNRQKPIARSASAWWPGGRTRRTRGRALPVEHALHRVRSTAPAAQQRRRVGARPGLGVRRRSARVRPAVGGHVATWAAVWTRSSSSRVASRGARSSSRASRPVAQDPLGRHGVQPRRPLGMARARRRARGTAGSS